MLSWLQTITCALQGVGAEVQEGAWLSSNFLVLTSI